MVVSAPEGANLMDPASWTAINPMPFDPAWAAGLQPQLPIAGYLEGRRTGSRFARLRNELYS